MIIKQTFTEIGSPPDWELVGIYHDEVEVNNEQGYGMSIEAHIVELVERLKAKRGESFVLVATELIIRPGSSHPSYGCRLVRVIGDLYHRRRPYGLREL